MIYSSIAYLNFIVFHFFLFPFAAHFVLFACFACLAALLLHGSIPTAQLAPSSLPASRTADSGQRTVLCSALFRIYLYVVVNSVVRLLWPTAFAAGRGSSCACESPSRCAVSRSPCLLVCLSPRPLSWSSCLPHCLCSLLCKGGDISVMLMRKCEARVTFSLSLWDMRFSLCPPPLPTSSPSLHLLP